MRNAAQQIARVDDLEFTILDLASMTDDLNGEPRFMVVETNRLETPMFFHTSVAATRWLSGRGFRLGRACTWTIQ